MAEDSVPIDASTIHELIKTVKSLQSDMAELKSGSNRDTIMHDRFHHLIQIPCLSRHHPHPLLSYEGNFCHVLCYWSTVE